MTPLFVPLFALGEAGVHYFLIEVLKINLDKNDKEDIFPQHRDFAIYRLILLIVAIIVYDFWVLLLVPIYFVAFNYPLNYILRGDFFYDDPTPTWTDRIVKNDIFVIVIAVCFYVFWVVNYFVL